MDTDDQREIRVAIAGVGNCASSLVQGVFYYRNKTGGDEPVSGIMHNVVGGYRVRDVRFVAAFDIDQRKVGKELSRAIFEKPNCTAAFCPEIPPQNVIVRKGPVEDGLAPHLAGYPEERRFLVDEGQEPVDVVRELKRARAHVLLNYLPVGSYEGTFFYARAALEAGCAFINCMPVFIASDPTWARRFEEKNLPVAGDDIKSQLGATILHRALARLFQDRGVRVAHTYQINVGGNTDFLNMLAKERTLTKKISKTGAVQAELGSGLAWEDIHIGPSDYVPWLNDQKICFLRMEGRGFGDLPVGLELRLAVEDSPNCAGSVIDVIRGTKLALDRRIGGALTSLPAYFMKHPPVQYPDHAAKQMVEEFISGERER